MKKKIVLATLLSLLFIMPTACFGVSDDSSNGTNGGSEWDDVVTYTVTFDSDGGSAVPSVTVEAGGKITAPKAPKKSSSRYEYEFLGWFYEGNEWDFETGEVCSDITLVAHWEKTDEYTEPFLPKN